MWHTTYITIATLLLVAAGLYAIRAALRVRHVPNPKGLPGRGLPLLDAAFLAGGPGRVVDTVLVRMHQEGRVIVSRGGLVTVTAGKTYDDVEAALITAAGDLRQRDLVGLRRTTMTSDAVQQIGNRLADHGLMRDPGRLRRARRARRLVWLTMLAVVVSTAVGLVVTHDRPEADRPSIAGALGLVALGLVFLLVSRVRKGRITPAGKRQLSLMTQGGPWKPRHGVGIASSLLLGAVALEGIGSGLPDQELQEAMLAASVTRPPVGVGGSSGSDGGASSCSSSSASWCGFSDSGSGGGSGSGCGSSGCGSSSSCGSGSSSCGSSSSSSCGSSSSSCGSSCGSGCGS
ncbi:TIGR04222 domain-containing membrane protein [Kitasatospora sp. NPDC057223]|uniref:TIGR04222 domain-containing membrane protein n=1 Tax=Kitasatospora sp. NPDC057223 TaxID=3346055 RepID=UPI003632C554